MTRLSIELQGKEEFRRAILAASQAVKDEVEAEVVATAIELRANIVKSIARGPKTGQVYRRGNVTHQASAPGQAPATDTGRLVNNIYFERLGATTAAVGSTLVYAEHLEYGTRKMAARPFFRPAVEKMRKQFQKRLEIAVWRATR